MSEPHFRNDPKGNRRHGGGERGAGKGGSRAGPFWKNAVGTGGQRAKSANPPKIARPLGTQSERARWLASWLASGRLSREAAAEAAGLEPEHIDEIAAGRSALASPTWQKLAALVATLAPERLS